MVRVRVTASGVFATLASVVVAYGSFGKARIGAVTGKRPYKFSAMTHS
jgi:hypothetical protein